MKIILKEETRSEKEEEGRKTRKSNKIHTKMKEKQEKSGRWNRSKSPSFEHTAKPSGLFGRLCGMGCVLRILHREETRGPSANHQHHLHHCQHQQHLHIHRQHHLRHILHVLPTRYSICM